MDGGIHLFISHGLSSSSSDGGGGWEGEEWMEEANDITCMTPSILARWLAHSFSFILLSLLRCMHAACVCVCVCLCKRKGESVCVCVLVE